MQTYDHHKSLQGSIPNVSTVHLNGIWHLIQCHRSKPVLHCRWTPCIKQTLEHSARVSAYTGFTVCFRVQKLISNALLQQDSSDSFFFSSKAECIFSAKASACLLLLARVTGCETDFLGTLILQVTSSHVYMHRQTWSLDNNTVYSSETISKNYLTFFGFTCFFPSILFLLFQLPTTSSESSEGESLKQGNKVQINC